MDVWMSTASWEPDTTWSTRLARQKRGQQKLAGRVAELDCPDMCWHEEREQKKLDIIQLE